MRGPRNLSARGYQAGADRHHGRGREHPDALDDHLRPGRDPLPSVRARGDAGSAGARRHAARPRPARPSEARPAQPVAQSRACAAARVAAAGTREGGTPDRAAQRQVRTDRRPGDGPARRQAQAHGVAVRAARRRAGASVPRVGLRLALQGRRRGSPAAVHARRDPRATRQRRRDAARPVRQRAVAGAARARRAGARRDRSSRAVARPAAAGVRRRLADR